MKTNLRSFQIANIAILLTVAVLATSAFANEAHNKAKAEEAAAGSLIKVSAAGVSAEWIAKAMAEYPLDVCPVTDDKLVDGDMGPPHDFVYRAEGQPDRLVRLCCKHCVSDFEETPDEFLKVIDDAATAKSESGK